VSGTADLRTALAEALPDRPFRVELWDGSALEPTNGGGPTFRVASPEAFGHVLRSPGQLGVGRAYVAGQIDVDDIDAALELLAS
jgi:cyclopropane-fatty-acyl-phospholipid synthase